MRKFVSDIFGLIVLLEDETEKEILSACEKAFRKETGGILIGVYSNENQCAQIITATTPTTDSKQLCNLFVRGKKGILSLLKQRWKEGQYYLGVVVDGKLISFEERQVKEGALAVNELQ